MKHASLTVIITTVDTVGLVSYCISLFYVPDDDDDD